MRRDMRVTRRARRGPQMAGDHLGHCELVDGALPLPGNVLLPGLPIAAGLLQQLLEVGRRSAAAVGTRRHPARHELIPVGWSIVLPSATARPDSGWASLGALAGLDDSGVGAWP